jgi:tripartite-type tricarboxylate transporter receptor subunit TctC
MTGKVHVLFDNLPGSIEFVRSGQLKALGVTVAKRWPGLADIPAIAETVPGYEAAPWYGISPPKSTPAEVIAILNKSMAAGLANPKMQAKLANLGGIPMPMSPAEFGKFVADDTAKWAKGGQGRQSFSGVMEIAWQQPGNPSTQSVPFPL